MSVTSLAYKKIFKPLAFKQEPEIVHDHIIKAGIFLGKSKNLKRITRKILRFDHPVLEQRLLGIDFTNPIGLAAGFDKNAELTDILADVGFGFVEVGSITGEPCTGNIKPRLWRLPKEKSLVVNYGLKNDGAESISKRLRNKVFEIPIGVSMAKTNSPDTVDTNKGIEDYVKAYKLLLPIGSYSTINISCPNAYGGQPFTDKEKLDRLLTEIDKIATTKPVFIKISPDLSFEEVEGLISVIGKHNVRGLICSNLTKKVEKERFREAMAGGVSGKLLEDKTNQLIKFVYQKTRGKYVIIGCGGIFTAEDAYRKIKLGASLLQMITGMIYEGPQVIGEINKGLVNLLKNDGLKNIGEAVGKDVVL